ncbi:MAG: hypothetical protein GF307_07120 [candidate division Zixibacteria bacterium]|nr:hypothetical protein [candidate division Zixibacteria bacterium]
MENLRIDSSIMGKEEERDVRAPSNRAHNTIQFPGRIISGKKETKPSKLDLYKIGREKDSRD